MRLSERAARLRRKREAERAERAHKAIPGPDVEAARSDPNAFIEYCFRDEKGRPLRQSRVHREWQELFTNEPRLALLGATGLGKTVQVGGRLVWELGRNHNLRIALVSSREGNAKKTLRVIRLAIERNPRVREVFPDLQRGDQWTTTAITIARDADMGVPSVQAAGWNTSIQGDRLDIIVCDDVNDLKNTQTEQQRAKVERWFDDTVQTRLVRPGGVAWVIGNAWHADDLIHTLAKRDGWNFARFAAIDVSGKLAWPEGLGYESLASIRKTVTALSFARMFLCQPLSDDATRFLEEWFEDAKKRAVAGGWQYRPASRPVWVNGGELAIYTAIDLASGKRGRKRKTDTTVLFTIAYHPGSGSYLVIDVRQGRWTAPQILEQMRDLRALYAPKFIVEDNGTQQLFVDIAKTMRLTKAEEDSLKVVGLTTGGEKWDPVQGIEGMAVDFEQKRWVIPPMPGNDNAVSEIVAKWLNDLLYFSPAQDHTSDLVMGSWIAWRGARRFHAKVFDYQR